MTNRKRKVIKNSKINIPALVSMRDTAWGWAALSKVRDTLFRAETMRDDDGLLAEAEAKRQRRAAKSRPT